MAPTTGAKIIRDGRLEEPMLTNPPIHLHCCPHFIFTYRVLTPVSDDEVHSLLLPGSLASSGLVKKVNMVGENKLFNGYLLSRLCLNIYDCEFFANLRLKL